MSASHSAIRLIPVLHNFPANKGKVGVQWKYKKKKTGRRVGGRRGLRDGGGFKNSRSESELGKNKSWSTRLSPQTVLVFRLLLCLERCKFCTSVPLSLYFWCNATLLIYCIYYKSTYCICLNALSIFVLLSSSEHKALQLHFSQFNMLKSLRTCDVGMKFMLISGFW